MACGGSIVLMRNKSSRPLIFLLLYAELWHVSGSKGGNCWSHSRNMRNKVLTPWTEKKRWSERCHWGVGMWSDVRGKVMATIDCPNHSFEHRIKGKEGHRWSIYCRKMQVVHVKPMGKNNWCPCSNTRVTSSLSSAANLGCHLQLSYDVIYLAIALCIHIDTVLLWHDLSSDGYDNNNFILHFFLSLWHFLSHFYL